MAFLACVHLALFLALFFSPLISHAVTMQSVLVLTVSNNSLFTPRLSRIHTFVSFAVYETHFISPFISKASRRVSSLYETCFFTRYPRTHKMCKVFGTKCFQAAAGILHREHQYHEQKFHQALKVQGQSWEQGLGFQNQSQLRSNLAGGRPGPSLTWA